MITAQTVKDSHRVIEVINWFIERELTYQSERHSLTANDISMRITNMLQELKDNELKFLETFNNEGPTP